MKTRVDGEVRERLRQLLLGRARSLGLTPAAVEGLRQAALLDRWGAGDVIVADGDGGQLAFVVVGVAQVVCATPRGKRIGVAFVPPGRFLSGGWTSAPGDPRDDLVTIARDPLGTVVATWAPRTVHEVLGGLPAPGALRLVTAPWREAAEVVRQTCHLLGLCLRDRVLVVLTTLARDFGWPHPDGRRIELRLTHLDLAGAAVGSRANVTRALEELRAEGLVAVEQHRLVVTHRGLACLGNDPGEPARWTGTTSSAAP